MRIEKDIALVAEEGATLSSGALRLYAKLSGSSPMLGEGDRRKAVVEECVEIVGCVDLYSYDPLNRRAAVGIMVANEYRRKGYALAMLHELSKFAIQNSKLHSLYADIAATNSASRSLLRKAGYEECGHFKEWLVVDDRYIDSIRMQKILS